MAVDKFSGAVPEMTAVVTRTLLEETLARFDEEVAQNDPDIIRQRLKKHLGNLRVNINGDIEA